MARLDYVKQNWAAVLGWTIFVGLMIALLADYYIFDPFKFGFAYYVVYALSTTLGANKNHLSYGEARTLSDRMLLVSAIALLYLWVAFNAEIRREQFVRQFQRTCYDGSYASLQGAERICSEIQSKIDNYLYRPEDGYLNQ